MSSVPFTIPRGPVEVADVEGIARLDEDALVLEFKTAKIAIVGSQPRRLRLAADEVASIHFERGWFNGRVTITTRRVVSLMTLPGARGLEVALQCRREDSAAAEEIVSNLQHRLSERQF